MGRGGKNGDTGRDGSIAVVEFNEGMMLREGGKGRVKLGKTGVSTMNLRSEGMSAHY